VSGKTWTLGKAIQQVRALPGRSLGQPLVPIGYKRP
jgi:hypothetical protein